MLSGEVERRRKRMRDRDRQARRAAGMAEPVTILMAVHNGAATLPAQLDSFATQSHVNWSLIAGDDASGDDSADLIRAFGRRAKGHDVAVVPGPRQGSAMNFLSLLRRVPATTGFVAFSDQDDVWFPDRLERGIAALRRVPVDCPALYCSRTVITDADLRPLRLSALRPRPPGFRNALAQNIAAGNTILLNAAAVTLLQRAAARTEATVAHDWWTYQVVTGAGGRVLHDDAPTLLYRQHGTNQIGANDGARAQIQRIGMILSGVYRNWTDVNLRTLTALEDLLTEENRALIGCLAALRERRLLGRVSELRAAALYRQTRLTTAALYAAALVNRF
jgi:hypothetical protein